MRRGVIDGLARGVSVIFAGLFAGFLITVMVVEWSLRSFDGSVYTQVRHVELDRLDDLASVLLFPALLATALIVGRAVGARDRGFWLSLTSLILLIFVVVVTLSVHVPINSEQPAWDVFAPPADWESVRDRWQTWHAVRTGAALVAFGGVISIRWNKSVSSFRCA